MIAALAVLTLVHATPYRLRADALAEAQAPAGTVILEGASELLPGLSIEAVLWMGAGGAVSPEADALVATLRYRDEAGRVFVRAGRFVLASGALMPVQLDGGSVLGRVGWASAELFAGLPVAPRFGERDFDWLVGGRLAATFSRGALGVGFVERRDAGQLADRTIGFDGRLGPFSGVDLGARVATDLLLVGVSEATAVVGIDAGALRVDVLGSIRSPSRLLPATSLFTVLGEAASRSAYARARLGAAPRLELSAEGGVRFLDADPHELAALGARLRVGERGDGTIALDLRRTGAPDGGWTGLGLRGRFPLDDRFALASELELVAPDDDARGAIWPWALAALTWTPTEEWTIAAAVEAHAGADVEASLDGLLRASWQWSDR